LIEASNVRVSKLASDEGAFARSFISATNCRTAIEAFMRAAGATAGQAVLVPAYIGLSAKEGSGIHDPIANAGASLRFYRVDRDLSIDLEHLEGQLKEFSPRVLLLVHYFGFPDPHFTTAAELGRSYGAYVLEDEAHAMFTDLVGGVSGRAGDAAVFSLHKMLPMKGGGIMVNPGHDEELAKRIGTDLITQPQHFPFRYDLAAIARKRRANSEAYLEHMNWLKGTATPLYSSLPEDVTPQTLPILIEGGSRDELYELANANGLGAVSLYHTLIPEITVEEFPDSHWLANRIFNLPVHQDMQPEQAEAAIHLLKGLIAG
jgi:dTDP-4-amino-4,6-dideoxygalactose transaminase